MVKKYIKYIENLRPDMPYYQRGTKLLWELYTMLCYACNYYLFSADAPFRSIGWEQPDLFRLLAEKVLGVSYSEKELSGILITVASGGLSREALHEMQMAILVRALKTPNEKYAALEVAQRLVLYCALNLISWFNDDDQTWIDVYRYGLKQKIKPREELQQEYAQRQANLS